MTKIIAAYKVGSYNTRRLSKPWIAKITKWEGQYPSLAFGASSTYEAWTEVEPGTVVKYGQKDSRSMSQHVNEFAVVQSDGELLRLTPKTAFLMFRMNCKLDDIRSESAQA